MAFGTVRTLRRRGVRVPEDMSVIGFDDIAEASISYPPLTTIRQPLYEMGRLAAEYICRVIDGIETETTSSDTDYRIDRSEIDWAAAPAHGGG